MVKNVGIVISDYYKDISIGLEQGAIRFCSEAKINFKKFYVPGALEIGSATVSYTHLTLPTKRIV